MASSKPRVSLRPRAHSPAFGFFRRPGQRFEMVDLAKQNMDALAGGRKVTTTPALPQMFADPDIEVPLPEGANDVEKDRGQRDDRTDQDRNHCFTDS